MIEMNRADHGKIAAGRGRHFLLILAAAVLGLFVLAAPALSAPDPQSPSGAAPAERGSLAAPVGCTTRIEWVQEGSSYYYGRGFVRCVTGPYRVKNQCRNLQSGEGYVVYGTQVVNAPAETSVTCNTGNRAEQVYAVESPAPSGVTGCASWMEWVHEGSSHYYGRGKVQCDTGNYRVQIVCHNLQSGQRYVVNGATTVAAPRVASTTCYSGNVAESVQAVPQ